MKFLAILKDSIREAIDAKVIYVTVGLSVLFSSSLVASISFRPVSSRGRNRGQGFRTSSTSSLALTGAPRISRANIEDFTQTNDAPTGPALEG